ncbi:MAG: hypothetical protein J6J31_12085 [Thermoguttaceae bacterium]|nr:hypothetical protein [Thermoguttaceae bacterium]
MKIGEVEIFSISPKQNKFERRRTSGIFECAKTDRFKYKLRPGLPVFETVDLSGEAFLSVDRICMYTSGVLTLFCCVSTLSQGRILQEFQVFSTPIFIFSF